MSNMSNIVNLLHVIKPFSPGGFAVPTPLPFTGGLVRQVNSTKRLDEVWKKRSKPESGWLVKIKENFALSCFAILTPNPFGLPILPTALWTGGIKPLNLQKLFPKITESQDTQVRVVSLNEPLSLRYLFPKGS